MSKTDTAAVAAAAPSAAPSAAASGSITLDKPIARGDTKITSIVIRKPQAGELRGVNLHDLFQMDVAALIKVLPRVTVPTLLAQEVERMEPCDLLACGAEVAGFFLSTADKQSLGM